MSTVNSSTSSTSATTTSSAASPSSMLGEGDFMTLLLAQLQNQDPLSPADSTQFVAELAQFSQVELQQDMSSQLGQLLTASAAGNEVSTASLGGRNVLYNTSSIQLTSTPPVALQANLGASAQNVVWSVTDSNGNVVKTINSTSQPAGQISVSWDGTNNNGVAQPVGTYTVAVSANNGANTTVQATLQGTGTVSSVTYAQGYPQLVIGGQNVSMSSLVQIYAPNTNGSSSP